MCGLGLCVSVVSDQKTVVWKGNLPVGERLEPSTAFDDPLTHRESVSQRKEGGRNLEEKSRRQSTRGYSVVSPESKRILLVSAWIPGSFQGRFDTDRSREQHTLKEAVMIINPHNRDSMCGDDYPPRGRSAQRRSQTSLPSYRGRPQRQRCIETQPER